MFILGKLLGAFFGFLIGGLFGAIIGGWIGHLFDKALKNSQIAFVFETVRDRHQIQQVFFETVFLLMGHMAKADGRVTEDEIQTARNVMQQMRLSDSQRKRAIELFTQGKDADFDVDGQVKRYLRTAHGNRMLSQMMLEMLVMFAMADGEVHGNEHALLVRIGTGLGFPESEVLRLLQRAQAQQHWHQAGYQQAERPPSRDALKDAYTMLDTDEHASDAEVKKAYRRQMNKHHPDKLTARGMPEEMIKMATEKTQEIKSAYELIMKVRASRAA
jgi:DnaJ like chaperone protein